MKLAVMIHSMAHRVKKKPKKKHDRQHDEEWTFGFQLELEVVRFVKSQTERKKIEERQKSSSHILPVLVLIKSSRERGNNKL